MAGVADAYGPADRGCTRVRLRADLLLVTRDHARDMTHTRDIVKVYKRSVGVSGAD